MSRLKTIRLTEDPVVTPSACRQFNQTLEREYILEIETDARVNQIMHRDNSWKNDESGSIET